MSVLVAMNYLDDLGIEKIIVNYSGSGDSGQIDEILFEDIEGNDNTEVNDDIREQIESLSYRLLDGVEDWYNNEGGFGTIVITVPDANYNIENNINITEVETYNHEGQLTDENE